MKKGLNAGMTTTVLEEDDFFEFEVETWADDGGPVR